MNAQTGRLQTNGTKPVDLGELVFGPLVADRTCGDCVVCCWIPEIKSEGLTKPAGTLCRHSTGQGCGIYPSRPMACRSWHCLWRRLARLGDELRPDLSGLLITLERGAPARSVFEDLFVRIRAFDGPLSAQSRLARRTIETFAQLELLPVWLSWAGHDELVFPTPDLADAILRPNLTPHRKLVPQALAWQKRFEVRGQSFR